MIMIDLKFKNTLTSLAGNDFGKTIFLEQVENKLDIENGTTIKFPDSIERIAISFIQGFSAEIVKKYGTEVFNSKLVIDGNERVKEKFRKVLV